MTFQLPNQQFLCATVGWPGSGKSTWAQSQLKSGKIVRVNRDAIRLMLGHQFNPKDEAVVHHMAMLIIDSELASGRSVICDDTNLNPKVQSNLHAIAKKHGVLFTLNKDFVQVPLEQCFAQDLKRQYSVGKDVILRMYYDYWRGQDKPANEGPQTAFICDLDGTFAHTNIPYPAAHNRDYTGDTIDEEVGAIIGDLSIKHLPIFMTGRSEQHREATRKWLDKAGFYSPCPLVMRKNGDNRADYIVKKELYLNHVQGTAKILFVLDDRPSVCRMWKAELGLKVLNVGDNIDF